MILYFDNDKLTEAFNDFYNSTDININLYTTDFTLLPNPRPHKNYCRFIQQHFGEKPCCNSDIELCKRSSITRKAEYHICHAGLIDVAVPVIYDNDILGYIILGQMKINEDYSFVSEKLSALGINTSETQKYYSELLLFDAAKVQSILNIAVMFTKYIILENILKPHANEYFEKALTYIHENLNSNLSIQRISDNTHLSRSVLYRYFHNYYHCTVNEYINSKRIEQAVPLLTETNLSIEEISKMIGFQSAAYFTKTFKKEKGIPPLKFRKAFEH